MTQWLKVLATQPDNLDSVQSPDPHGRSVVYVWVHTCVQAEARGGISPACGRRKGLMSDDTQ